MSILCPVLKCSRKRALLLPTLDNPGSDLAQLKKGTSKVFVNPCPLPSLAMQVAVSLPPLPPCSTRQDSHVGKACLSDSSRNGLYGSQHGVEQLCQLSCRSFHAASLLHNKSRECQHICFEGAFVGHFCWVPGFLSSWLDKMLSCCVEILGSCFILRRSCWLCCWSEFIKTFLRPRD